MNNLKRQNRLILFISIIVFLTIIIVFKDTKSSELKVKVDTGKLKEQKTITDNITNFEESFIADSLLVNTYLWSEINLL